MDGENNGKPYMKMDDFGGTIIFGNTRINSRLITTVHYKVGPYQL